MQNADTPPGSRGRLEEAMAALVQSQASLTTAQATLAQSQATLIQNQAAFVREMAEVRRELAEYQRRADERYAQIMLLLAEHGRLLEKMREEVRGQFGLRPHKPE